MGTESGDPRAEIWSTGSSGAGDPDSAVVCPKGCDTTLQLGDVWFFQQQTGIRSLAEPIHVYHATVGRNGVLELDFAIDRDGLVAPSHAARYKELGDWVRSCYGAQAVLAEARDVACAAQGCSVEIALGGAGGSVDRVVVQEDIGLGQRIRAYTVEVMGAGGAWQPFSEGHSVGHKRIDLGTPVNATRLRLTVTAFIAPAPLTIARFAAFAPCPSA